MILIQTNLPEKAQADAIVQDLLDAHLVACANGWAIDSAYWWQGKLEKTTEYRLVLKTTNRRADAVIRWLRDHHPHQNPWISRAEATAEHSGYARWLERETRA